MSLSSQNSAAWFEHSIRVQPQDTDYAGIVWHGTYLGWMEAGRIAAHCERLVIEFADLVQAWLRSTRY